MSGEETPAEPEFRWFTVLLLAPLWLPILGGGVPAILFSALLVLPGFDHAMRSDLLMGLSAVALAAAMSTAMGWCWWKAAKSLVATARGASAFPLLGWLALLLTMLCGGSYLLVRVAALTKVESTTSAESPAPSPR